jgi:predicted dehydrogenase
LPAFRHAARNSRVTALVSDDPVKRRARARAEGIEHRGHVLVTTQYEACLEQVDAVYIALPNSQHAEYTVSRRQRRGVHDAVREADGGFTSRRVPPDEPGLPPPRVKADESPTGCTSRRSTCGDRPRAPRPDRRAEVLQLVVLDDGDARRHPHRSGLGGGTLYDIGVYCINAARYLFRAEPTEVMAISVNSGARSCGDRRVDGRAAALRGETRRGVRHQLQRRDVASYRIVGRRADPRRAGLRVRRRLEYELTIDGKTTRKRIGKRDQFAPSCCTSPTAS